MVSLRSAVGVAAAFITAVSASAPTISLDNGLVLQGRLSENSSKVAEFLSIPYAEPPIGDLRWEPPVLYSPSKTEVINATALPPSCYQFISTTPSLLQHAVYGWMISDAGMSEDCLKVSVWAPVDAAAQSANLPVIIYFYGGGFATGGTDVPYQSPAQWVARSQAHIAVVFK
jgi:carboxylesterase type B